MTSASLLSWADARAVLASDPAQLLPARQQMAFTLAFHIVLVPFGVAFTFIMMIANYQGVRRGDRDALLLAERWSRVAAVLFAVGAVSGTVLSFELGLLWPRLARCSAVASPMPVLVPVIRVTAMVCPPVVRVHVVCTFGVRDHPQWIVLQSCANTSSQPGALSGIEKRIRWLMGG